MSCLCRINDIFDVITPSANLSRLLTSFYSHPCTLNFLHYSYLPVSLSLTCRYSLGSSNYTFLQNHLFSLFFNFHRSFHYVHHLLHSWLLAYPTAAYFPLICFTFTHLRTSRLLSSFSFASLLPDLASHACLALRRGLICFTTLSTRIKDVLTEVLLT